MARERAPQSLYSGVKIDYGKKVAEAPKEPYEGYVRLVRSLAKMFRGYGRGAKFTDDQRNAIEFLNITLSPEDMYAAKKGLTLVGIVFGILAAAVVAFTMGVNPLEAFFDPMGLIVAAVVGVVFAGMGMGFAWYITNFPISQAENEKKLAIAYVPEIINYLVMNMRLNPNLEKSVDFAASHGRGKIADDFKKLVWDVQIGVYVSVEEGLDALAYRWGNYNDDFKQALMLIRASVLEGDEARRDALLEKAGNDVLEGSKEKMDIYARQLHQPTVYLYYFGILLPLMLAIVLPIATGVMKDLPIKGVLPFVLIYNIFLPLAVFAMAKGIISGRPPTYVPPDIPEKFEGLPPRGTFRLGNITLPYVPLAIAAIVACFVVGNILDATVVSGLQSNFAVFDPAAAVDAIPHLSLPFGIRLYQFSIYAILLGIGLGISIYLYGKYVDRKRMQDEIRYMEGEFKDALYVLASRLGENRPVEDALRHSIEFLPKSKVANKVFKRTLENISMLGMTLDKALFDPTFGSMRNVPSQMMRSGMRILTDSVQLGVNVAAMSLINLAMQIRNAQKIDNMLRELLSDVTTMLKTMGTFIAPIVLAVVTSLQKVILNSMTSNCPDSATTAAAGGSSALGGGGIASTFCNIDPASAVAPGEFTLVMGIYVIEIVILLSYFNAQIEDTNNELHQYMSIASALPIAVIVFSVVSYLAASFLAPAA